MTSWKRSLSGAFTAMATAVLLSVSLTGPASAQEETSVPAWLQERLVERVMHRRDNGEMMQLVRPIAESVNDGVVGVICGGRPVSLGTVVARSSLHVGASVATTDAYVITKRSELSNDPIRVRLRDGRM
ncbi:MAG: serine protease, partial [Rhodopirellula bahusiensis]